jgi:hypothetical protein
MTEHDRSLRQTLHRWPSPEPGAGFDAEVWRRIRARPVATWTERLATLFEPVLESRPAFAAACALTLALGSLAILVPGRVPRATPGATSLTSPMPVGLAPAYVRMMAGGER